MFKKKQKECIQMEENMSKLIKSPNSPSFSSTYHKTKSSFPFFKLQLIEFL